MSPFDQNKMIELIESISIYSIIIFVQKIIIDLEKYDQYDQYSDYYKFNFTSISICYVAFWSE